jgi:tryptophanyl-tRNA synthetase
MSKSRNNTINIFLPEKELRKQVMSIVTDSKGLEESKDPNSCNVFHFYKLLATENEVNQLSEKYLAGGFGYGHAKQALLELLLDRFAHQREKYTYLMNNKSEIDLALAEGAKKARIVAQGVIGRVRNKVGFGH